MLRGLVCAIGALLLLAPAAHGVRRAPCVEGSARPKCTFWDAKVKFIADGDTIRADVEADGTHAVKTIRFSGINAMELSRYSKYPSRRRGACHGLAATSLVERYIRGSKLARAGGRAEGASSHSAARQRRSVWVKVRGRWRDLAKLELNAGAGAVAAQPDRERPQPRVRG